MNITEWWVGYVIRNSQGIVNAFLLVIGLIIVSQIIGELSEKAVNRHSAKSEEKSGN